MEQAGVFACPIIRGLGLVVELQRKLYVPRVLRARNLPHCASKIHIRCVEVDVIEGVHEIATELKLVPFRKLKVLLQA